MEHLLQEITPWVSEYGLWIVFFGMIFEGTTMIIVTGILCYLGMLPLRESLLVAIIGAALSDQAWYLLGKYFSSELFNRFPKLRKKVEKLAPTIITKGNWLAFFSRFIYSGAVLFPMTLGMEGYSYRKFVLFDTTGVTLWSSAGITLGYLLGNSSQHLFGEIKTIEHLALIIVVVAATVWWIKKKRKTT